MTTLVEFESRDRIGVLRFNRPGAQNALRVKLAQAIADSLIALDRDEAVDGIVKTGSGDRAFCINVDLQEALTVQVHVIKSWLGTVCNIYKQILLAKNR